jgi:hypothetical protein
VDKCKVIEKALLPMESILAAMDSEPQNFVPPCSDEEITMTGNIIKKCCRQHVANCCLGVRPPLNIQINIY